MSVGSFRQMPHRQSQSSFNETTSPAQLPEMYAQAPAPTTDDSAFAPWLFEVAPYDTPLSRASSYSGSGYVSTPQSLMDIDQPSMYHMEGHQAPHSVDYTTRGSGFPNDLDLAWQHALESGNVFEQVLAPSTSWPAGDWRGPPLPPINLYNPTTNYGNYSTRKSAHPTTRKPLNAEISTVGSVSDSDDSDYDDSGSSYSQRGKSSNANDSVLKLGKWSMIDPFTQPPQRIYVCPLDAKSGPKGSHCDQRFVRPEHLRRHMKTVHGSLRPHFCKLPGCDKAFSRGDNLRDHYWTHVQRGGRVGKNQKMSLSELKEILGPKEKKLIRKLKEKFHKQRVAGRVAKGCKL